MAEKINHDKTENEIRDDVIDLKVRHFRVDSSNANQSNLITKAFGYENAVLKGKLIPFFYSEILDNSTNVLIDNYFKTLKQDLKYAYDVPTILQNYEDAIDTLDRPANLNLKVLLPRYKKMKRLESFYKLLIKFTLSVLHNFFWVNINLSLEKGAGSKNISYRVKQIMTLMMKVKKIFEDEIDREYPTNLKKDLDSIYIKK